MRSIALLVLFTVAVASADDAPVVDKLNPASGPVNGGTVVTITGRNFIGACVSNCRPAVLFYLPHPDGCCVTGYANILSATDTTLVVEMPPHPTGRVDVIVRGVSGDQTIVRGAFLFGREGYRRILVPVAFEGELPGAFGSRWVTELVGRGFYADSDVEVTRRPFSGPRNLYRGPFTFTDLPSQSRGMFLYVVEGAPLAMSLRVRDVSRSETNFGTEIPLVTSEETSTAYSLNLLGIPIEPKYRQTLRLYNFEGRRATNIGVRVIPRNGTKDLTYRGYAMPEELLEEFPTEPGYMEIDLRTLLPVDFTGLIDVSVSHPAGPRIWAMVSVTNNETQLVTMVTPTMEVNPYATVVIADGSPP